MTDSITLIVSAAFLCIVCFTLAYHYYADDRALAQDAREKEARKKEVQLREVAASNARTAHVEHLDDLLRDGLNSVFKDARYQSFHKSHYRGIFALLEFLDKGPKAIASLEARTEDLGDLKFDQEKLSACLAAANEMIDDLTARQDELAAQLADIQRTAKVAQLNA